MPALRKVVGTAFGVTAQGLSLASKVLTTVSKTMRPAGGGTTPESTPERPASRPVAVVDAPVASEPIGTEAVIAEVADDVPERGRVVEPPATPLLDETPHVRTSESHIEELAAKPAGQVAAAVSSLSTDELRLLTEYEMEHKNRRTVLNAIEKALAPPPAGGSGDEIILPEAGGVPTSGTLDA